MPPRRDRRWLASLFLLSVSVLTACGGPSLAQRLTPLESIVQQAVDEQKIPGAVILLQRADSEETWLYVAGQMDREQGTPLAENSLFRIASMTKPVTSVAVMMLVEEGKLGLDEPVSKYLPEWAEVRVLDAADASSPGGYRTVPAHTPITIRQLLTHTSGISYGFMGGPLYSYYAQAGITDGFQHTSLTLAEQSRVLAAQPLKLQPGSGFHYGLNTDLLGYLIEKVSGQPLDQFFQERLFTPLGMKDTHLFLPPEKLSRLPVLYRRTATGALERVPTGANVQEGSATYAADFHYSGAQRYRSGGAGLVSTAADYARFLRMVYNGGEYQGTRLLKRETVALMTQNQIGSFRADFFNTAFGLGFAVQDDPARTRELGSVGTFFWSGIFKTAAWVDPQERVIGVVMVNMWDLPSKVVDELRGEIHTRLRRGE